ncbi:Uncharacterised protein [Mycobacteroides abscessus subsp. abscessus]|nr:Uncharacterised protein [Mycobacteroides abscessus subsp. abscessus]
MRRITGQEHPPVSIPVGLTCHIGEAGYPPRIVYSEICSRDGDQRFFGLFQRRFDAEPVQAGTEGEPAPAFFERQDAEERLPGLAQQAELQRLFGDFGIDQHRRAGRVMSRKADPGRLADGAAPAVTPDEVLTPQGAPVGKCHVHAGVVLTEANSLGVVIDRYPELADPGRQRLLGVVLQ